MLKGTFILMTETGFIKRGETISKEALKEIAEKQKDPILIEPNGVGIIYNFRYEEVEGEGRIIADYELVFSISTGLQILQSLDTTRGKVITCANVKKAYFLAPKNKPNKNENNNLRP